MSEAVTKVFTNRQLKLPKKPSDLIEVALGDLRRVERLKKTYVVDMGTWHSPNSHCAVCFAGSVMARILPPEEDESNKFDGKLWEKFYALNYFREGNLLKGLISLGIAWKYKDQDFQQIIVKRNKELPRIVDVPDYHDDRKGFYKAMKKMVKLLRGVGL